MLAAAVGMRVMWRLRDLVGCEQVLPKSSLGRGEQDGRHVGDAKADVHRCQQIHGLSATHTETEMHALRSEVLAGRSQLVSDCGWEFRVGSYL